MAKAKKQELSIEEKLAQALVPKYGQPYKVPENWVWARLGDIIQVIMGQSPKGVDTTDDDRYIGLIGGAADMGGLFPEVSRYTVKPTRLSQKDDVIVSIRATLGRPIYSDGEYCIGRGVCALSSDIMSSSFIRYFILNFEDYLYNVATGTTFAQVSKNDIEKMPFPLPPLVEQQRIVDRIESLFEKLDRAKELLQDALDTFEIRKAAILHKAFTGKLTAKWRENNGMEMDSWKEIRLGDLLNPMITRRPDNDKQTFRYIDIDAIDNKTQTVREPKTTLVSEAPSRASRSVETGNVVFSLVRPYLKNIAYIGEELSDCIASTGFYVCRCKPQLDSIFLYYLLCSQDTINYYTSYMKGDNSPSIRKVDFEGLIVTLPPLPEQQEIVRILDSLFEKEQKAKELCEIIDKIELMKKAILARAFRGKLGTNDPKEESAIELLKECLK